MRCRLGRGKGAPVLDEVAEVGVFLLTDRCLQRDRFLRDLDDLADLLGVTSTSWPFDIASAISSTVGSRPSSWRSPRETRISRLIVSTMWTGMRIVRAWSAMARVMAWRIHQVAYVENLNPFVVELLDRPNEADVALLDEVQEGHAAADVLLRDRHDQPQVRRRQLLARVTADLDDHALAVAQLELSGTSGS